MAVGKLGRGVGKSASLALQDRATAADRARQSPHHNHLLHALPAADFARIAPHLELIPMGLGDVLYESGAKLRHVYFPTTSIVSLLYVMEDGASAEIAVVGNEGMLGISLFMGGETTPSRAVVQSAGYGYRLQGAAAEGGVRPLRPDDAPAAALHAGADHADGADGGVQSAPFGRPAAVPLAAAEPRPPVVERAVDDAGTDRQHARRAPRGRHRGRRQAAGCRADPLPAAARSRCWTARRLEARTCECYQVVKAEFDRLLPYVAR